RESFLNADAGHRHFPHTGSFGGEFRDGALGLARDIRGAGAHHYGYPGRGYLLPAGEPGTEPRDVPVAPPHHPIVLGSIPQPAVHYVCLCRWTGLFGAIRLPSGVALRDDFDLWVG